MFGRKKKKKMSDSSESSYNEENQKIINLLSLTYPFPIRQQKMISVAFIRSIAENISPMEALDLFQHIQLILIDVNSQWPNSQQTSDKCTEADSLSKKVLALQKQIIKARTHENQNKIFLLTSSH